MKLTKMLAPALLGAALLTASVPPVLAQSTPPAAASAEATPSGDSAAPPATQAALADPAAIKRLRDDGPTFISAANHLVRPMSAAARAQNQLGFVGSGGYTGTAGTKPFRFGISTFGRLLASMTSVSWMIPFR